MPSTPDLELLSHAELIKLVRDLMIRIEPLERAQAEHAHLRNENKRLKDELEHLKRQSARSAVPFSRNQSKKHPKAPGRKPGVGAFKHRPAPEGSSVKTVVNVPASTVCPACQTPTLAFRTDLAWLTDIPEITPEITEYRLEVRACPKCGGLTRGEHRLIPASQTGITAHRLGPRVLALTSALRFDHGLTARRVPVVLKDVFNLRVTHSALVQSAIRSSRQDRVIGAQYEGLRSKVRTASVVNTDDTSWALHGKVAFLMVFKTSSSLVYQIRSSHRTKEVLELVASSFNGVLVADRFVTYDAKALGHIKHQKCLAHLLKNLKGILEKPKPGRSQVFPRALRAVFKDAIRLHTRFVNGELEEHGFKRQGKAITRRLDRLLEPRDLRDKDNARLRRELGWHHARGSLLRFLENLIVSPTNNAAERALRPAVVARELSAGSKNEAGARAFCAFKSVIETAKLAGGSAFNTLVEAYSHPRR